jgi:hypothetical protein
MEEFIDLYRYLARCYAKLEKLNGEKVEGFLQRISEVVVSEKTGPVLIKLLLHLVKRSDEVDELDNGLNTILPSILEIEDKFSNSDNISNETNETRGDISDGRRPIFDKKSVLRSFGACKVHAKIFNYIFAKLDTKFRNPDIAILIKKYYNDVLKRQLAQSSSVTYAGCYVKYMYEKGLIIDHSFGVYSKKTNETKETKDLKKFGENINGNGSIPVEPPKDEPKPTYEDKLRNKFVNNEFEDFQNRILEVAESNGWKQVSIKQIEETFKGTKSEEQVQKALGRLLVKEKIIQMPPTPSDIIYAKENDEPKPKGYIIFKKNREKAP